MLRIYPWPPGLRWDPGRLEIPQSPWLSRSLRTPWHVLFRTSGGPTCACVSVGDWPARLVHGKPYHWKGLLLPSLAFQLLAPLAQQAILVRLPGVAWTVQHAAVERRGHLQGQLHRPSDAGAISGYIELQNDPRGRDLRISRDRAYWNSRFRGSLWATAYSTESEIGPLGGEAGIFHEGGYTYPINCVKKSSALGRCENPSAESTNNTGWVDFIITPVVGTLWLNGEDTIDRYITNPLVANHPNGFGYKVIRSTRNPPRSLPTKLRGRYPWYRNSEHPTE